MIAGASSMVRNGNGEDQDGQTMRRSRYAEAAQQQPRIATHESRVRAKTRDYSDTRAKTREYCDIFI